MTLRAMTALTAYPDAIASPGQGAAASPIVAARRDPEQEIRAALSGGRYHEALASCVRDYGELLGRLCMALVGSQTEAEDLVQETLLAAHRGFHGYRDEGTVKAWLSSIARRKCARHLETRSRSKSSPNPGPDLPAAASVEEDVLLGRHASRARTLLDSIRPSEREALVLRYAVGLTFREVAQACGIDEAAARKRVSRALARLRSQLGAEE